MEILGDATTAQNFGEAVGRIRYDAERRASWKTHSARWHVIFILIGAKVEKPESKGSGDKEEKEEETDKQTEEAAEQDSEPGENNDDEDSGGGFLSRLGEEFGDPDAVKQWFTKKLPDLFLIGKIWSLVVQVYEFGHFCWDKFVWSLEWIGEKLDLENNIFTAISWFSNIWFPFRWLVRILATMIYFMDWIIASIIGPGIRFYQDPAGRSSKFVSKKMKPKKTEDDAEDSEGDSDTDVGTSN